jgi:pyruvate/2-oxoglutarate dehydrogenase complex dihydrolipoamide acyltransferase (E2) component
VVAGIGAFLVLAAIVGSITGGGEVDATATSAAPATATEPSAAERSAAEEQARAEAAAKAEADRLAAEREAEAARIAAEARAAEEAAKLNPANYDTIGSRDYALIAKSPDAHAGEKYVLYGYVKQFDSATGPDAFLADTDAEQHTEWYEYDTNTLVVAEDPSILAPVVEDDIVKMYVEVVGSFSYDTQIGGNTTVPQVTVRMIEVVGSVA